MNKKEIKIKGNNDKCKSCGAEMRFAPQHQNLFCPSCGSVHQFAKSKEIANHLVSEKPSSNKHREWLKNNKFLQCDNCGAKMGLGKNELSTICPYCGSDFVSEMQEIEGVKPDAIIPFKFDENFAGKEFKRRVKNKFFVPSNFKKNLPSNKVKGVYIPAFAFDADTVSEYSGRLVKTDDDEIVDTFAISGNSEQQHRNILVEASDKISDYDLQNLMPFDLNESYKYDANFIKGYSVEHYHEIMEHCINIAHNKMDNAIKDKILEQYTYKRVNSLDIKTTYNNEKYTYYLLPIYNLEYTYENKKYVTHMNGQTGQICGDLPVSKAKVGALVGIGVLLFGILLYNLLKYII